MYSLIVDLFLAVLLVVTIGYAIILNKRLGSLRRDKAQLEKLSVSFGQSTLRAEESINKLTATADLLQDRMESAQGLRDDLVFLIDRGGQAADKLEEFVRASRDIVGVGPGPAPMPVRAAAESEALKTELKPLKADTVEASKAGMPAPKVDAGEFRSEAEQELLRAIRSAG